MKTTMQKWVSAIWFYILPFVAPAQNVIIGGTAVVGLPNDGDTLLTLNSERPWMFRQLGTGSGTSLQLYSTVGLKNLLITTTGFMGVDVLAPAEKLHVNGNIKANGSRISFGTSEYIQDDGSFLIACNGTLRSTLDNTDNLGSSNRRWNTVWASNCTISTSDIRQKTNIRNIPYGLSQVMMLHPVSFHWLDNPMAAPRLGLVAQEVQQVIKEVVVDHEWVRDEKTAEIHEVPVQNLGMYYADLIPVLIKAIQEQQQLINQKETRIDLLEQKMKLLEAKVAKLN